MNKELQQSLKQLNEYAQNLKQYLDKSNDEDFDFESVLNEHGIDIKKLEEDFLVDNTKIPLYFKKLNSDAVAPKYNYDTDSGFDLYSVEEIELGPFGRTLVPTGLSFDIRDGYEIQVRSKSGLAINQGLMCLNSPGTVDNGYTGEVKVIIFNTNNHPVTIKKGMKVAQAVYCPVVNGKWISPVEKSAITDKDRKDNGFGSTGI